MSAIRSFLTVLRFLCFSAVFVLAALFAGDVVAKQNGESLFTVLRADAASVQTESSHFTVVIDAGHGGLDGGAVSDDGSVVEKDLNLAVALRLAEMLSFSDVRVVMTRTDDRMLASDTSSHKKRDDLQARVELAQAQDNAVFVSIHMNKFPVAKYNGLQVYYAPANSQSGKLAAAIAEKTTEILQKDNKRETKPADSSIYILNHLTMPAVLVECGFLSNPEETALLCDAEYREKLVAVLYAAITDYLS